MQVTPDEAPLTIRVLGGISAFRGAVEVDLGGPRQRAVLAVLLSARGRSIPAPRLIELVWGDAAPARATNALQAYVSHLRKRLEPERQARGRAEILRSEPSGYSLNLPPDAVDAWRFESLVNQAGRLVGPAEVAELLREALALWRGDAFAGYEGSPWAEAESTRWAELRAAAEDQLFAARLELDRPGLLIPDLEAAVADEPLREERWRLLALALYREHRQGDALAAIRRARAVLADELGIDLGPALRELETQLFAQAPDLLGPDESPSPAAQPLAATSATPPGRDAIVDRDAELAEVDAVLAAAWRGGGSVLVIQGPAGIGKTRLLAEARDRTVSAESAVLTARGSQLEQQFAFGAVRQLFEPLLRDPAETDRLFAGAADSARVVFEGSAAGPDRSDGAFAVLNGLFWLTVNASADRPLLLTVDDLQWCDTGSLRFFAFLAHRLEGLPIALAATLRTGEEYAEPALIGELQLGAGATLVRPAPLSLVGVGAMVRRALGDDADARFVAACHRTTGGNPLLLRQVLRALEADHVKPDAAHADVVTAIGSRAVASLVLMRLSRLSEAATKVAQAVSVLGDFAELPSVAALAGLEESETAEAIASLARSELLRDEYPLSFVHPLIRDAIYRDVPPGVRQLQHERAARALDASGAAAEKVAAHLLQVPARGDGWVCDVLCRAAEIASERGTPESAASYLERALSEPPPPDRRTQLLLQLGTVETLHDGTSSIRHLREAYDLMPPGPERAELAQVLTQVMVFTAAQGEATEFAHEAVRALHPALADERQGLIALERCTAHMHGLDPAAWQDQSAIVTGDGPGARRLAAATAWELTIAGQDMPRASELARFALRDGILQQHDTGLLWVVAALVLDFADEDLTEFWAAARADALARGSLFSVLAVHLWSGHAQWRAGDLRAAQALLDVSAEQSVDWGSEIGVPYGDAYITNVLLDRGDVVGARRHIESTRPRARLGEGSRLWLEAECEVLLAEGRFAEALDLVDIPDSMTPYVTSPIHARGHAIRAAALAGLGRRDEAIEYATEVVARSRAWGAPRQTGASLVDLGRIKGAAGEEHLREAVEILQPTRGRVPLVRAQLGLAALMPGSAEAKSLLHRAREMADECAADGLRRAAETALRASGESVPERRAAARLTATETLIARLTLEGADVLEIARKLFLTPRAVQLALAEVHELVGVESDDELSAALEA